MAEKGTISSRLQLDGEKEYKKALNDAYRSLRVLRSELKAETAEMGRNASEQDKARKKIESLKKQIAEQEKVVKTLTKAFEDSKEQYKDNQEVQDKWEEKLNKAREALAKMKNEMDSASDGLKKIGGDMKDVSGETNDAVQGVVSLNDSLKSIGDVVGNIGSGISGVFEATLSTMESMVDKMMELMGKAWAAAGDWNQIQSMWGGNLEDIEKVFVGMSLQGVESGAVNSGISKLVANVHAGNKDTMAALKKLGIAEADYDNHWSFYMGVMEKMARRYDAGENVDELSRALFGEKQGAGQNDVVANWSEAMGKYQRDVEDTGLKLFDDEIKALDDTAHKIQEVQALWEVVQTNVGAKLSDILNVDQLAEDTLDILLAAGELFNSKGENKKEIVITLTDKIEKLIEDISGSAENLGGTLQEIGNALSGSDNSVVSMIGKMISSAGDLLDWLAENSDTIIAALDKILPWVIANKGLEAVTGKGIGEWGDTLLQTGLSIAQMKMLGGALGSAAKGSIAAEAVGTSIGTTAAGLLKAAIPATIVLKIAWDFAENMPSDWLSIIRKGLGLEEDGDAVSTVDKVNKEAGIEKVGDQIERVKTAPQEQNQKAMRAIGDFLLHPWEGGSKVEEPAAEPAEEPGISAAAREAAEAMWDQLRGAGDPTVTSMDLIERMGEAFGNMEQASEMWSRMNDLLLQFDEGSEPENLPDDWFDKEDIQGLKAPEGWYVDVQGMLQNLMKDSYTGDEKKQEQSITIQITANTNLDGRLIAQEVSEQIYRGMNKRMYG